VSKRIQSGDANAYSHIILISMFAIGDGRMDRRMTCPIEILCIKCGTILKVSTIQTTRHITWAKMTLVRMIDIDSLNVFNHLRAIARYDFVPASPGIVFSPRFYGLFTLTGISIVALYDKLP
jgi:hypothetical protein